MQFVTRVIPCAVLAYAGTAHAQSARDVSTLSDVLQSTGGWGLSAILLVAIVLLVRDNLKQRDSRTQQMQDQYDELFKMMEHRIETDVKYEESLKQLTVLVTSLLTKDC